MAHDFSQPEYLYRLARSGSMHDRKDLAQAVTGMLRSALTSAERGLAQDILLQLLTEAELDLRQDLATQLAVEPDCPQVLLDFLIYENPIAVSESVLRLSEKLSDEYLIEVAKHFDSSDYWLAMAQRKNIGEDLTRFLIGTDDSTVFQVLVKNQGASLCNSGITWLINASPFVPELQKDLILRPEVTTELAAQLYCHVSEDLRQQIQQRFTIDKKMLDTAMERVMRHRLVPKKENVAITLDARLKAQRMKEENSITSRQILESLKNGDVSLFVCLWGALLMLEPDIILKKLGDDFIQTLSVLAHAARITRTDYNTMFQQWRRLNVFQDNALASIPLNDVMTSFDKMTLEKSRKAIDAWTAQSNPTIH